MSAAFEAFLARLYTDAAARERFLADPRGESARAGLGLREQEALAGVDRVGLELASASFAAKRSKTRPRTPPFWRRFF